MALFEGTNVPSMGRSDLLGLPAEDGKRIRVTGPFTVGIVCPLPESSRPMKRGEKEKRAEYDSQIVAALGRQLESAFGRGFSEKSLCHVVRFAEAFPDPEIVSELRRQLGWTHFPHTIFNSSTYYSFIESGRL
jgi:hypothetical protein